MSLKTLRTMVYNKLPSTAKQNQDFKVGDKLLQQQLQILKKQSQSVNEATL